MGGTVGLRDNEVCTIRSGAARGDFAQHWPSRSVLVSDSDWIGTLVAPSTFQFSG